MQASNKDKFPSLRKIGLRLTESANPERAETSSPIRFTTRVSQPTAPRMGRMTETGGPTTSSPLRTTLSTPGSGALQNQPAQPRVTTPSPVQSVATNPTPRTERVTQVGTTARSPRGRMSESSNPERAEVSSPMQFARTKAMQGESLPNQGPVQFTAPGRAFRAGVEGIMGGITNRASRTAENLLTSDLTAGPFVRSRSSHFSGPMQKLVGRPVEQSTDAFTSGPRMHASEMGYQQRQIDALENAARSGESVPDPPFYTRPDVSERQAPEFSGALQRSLGTTPRAIARGLNFRNIRRSFLRPDQTEAPNPAVSASPPEETMQESLNVLGKTSSQKSFRETLIELVKKAAAPYQKEYRPKNTTPNSTLSAPSPQGQPSNYVRMPSQPSTSKSFGPRRGFEGMTGGGGLLNVLNRLGGRGQQQFQNPAQIAPQTAPGAALSQKELNRVQHQAMLPEMRRQFGSSWAAESAAQQPPQPPVQGASQPQLPRNYWEMGQQAVARQRDASTPSIDELLTQVRRENRPPIYSAINAARTLSPSTQVSPMRGYTQTMLGAQGREAPLVNRVNAARTLLQWYGNQ